MRKSVFVFSAIFGAALFCSAQANAVLLNDRDTELRVYELPLLDLPFNGGAFPSMQQSMELSTGFYLFAHNYLLDTFIDGGVADKGNRFSFLPIFAFDAASVYLPFGVAWLHEEWHRAVLGRRGIDSHNGVYNLDLFSSSIPVDRVRDQDLINLKRDHPAEMVRLHSAGIESEYEMALEFEKQGFFNNHHPSVGLLIHFNYLSNFLYMRGCASNVADRETDADLRKEGANISERDFTGFDCTAWVYDLFRPDEPYEARGVHPSGVGVNRYRKFSDLTEKEQNYLKLQRNLSLLNYVDPFLIGKKQFTSASGEWLWNATLRHHLTPFGYTLDTNIFLKERSGLDIFGTVHFYVNDAGTYPGMDVTLPRYPVNLFGKLGHVTPRAAAWVQPEHLLFRDAAWKPGGLLSARVDVPLGYGGWEIYGELEGKTGGWVAGSEYLGSNVNARVGFTRVLEVKSRWKTSASEARQ